MPYPRPPHTIELTIPHVLTDAQFEELEDLTFLHFENTLEAWPISLRITSQLNELCASPSSSSDDDDTSDPGSSISQVGAPPPPPLELVKHETTTISVSTSKEWDAVSEEAVRTIVRNILVEIMGGG
nr:hypothetical protein L204_03576 [Cryptococcus depauperatus CBS 7855]